MADPEEESDKEVNTDAWVLRLAYVPPDFSKVQDTILP